MAGTPTEVCKLEGKNLFLQNLLPGRARLKKKVHPIGGSERKVFFTSAQIAVKNIRCNILL